MQLRSSTSNSRAASRTNSSSSVGGSSSPAGHGSRPASRSASKNDVNVNAGDVPMEGQGDADVPRQPARPGRVTRSQTAKKRQPAADASPGSLQATADVKEYEVEKIVGHCMDDQGTDHYCIKWRGYPWEQNTWEPLEHLTNCQDRLEEFLEYINESKAAIDGLMGRDMEEDS